MARAAVGAAGFPLGVAVGTGVGTAVGAALGPKIQGLANEAWSRYQTMPIEALDAAQLVADGERPIGWGITEAANNGINEARFRALVDLADTSLELAQIMEAWRRNLISDEAFRRGVKRHSIEEEWIDVLVQLRRRLLTPDTLANAVVQGFRSQDAAREDATHHGISGPDFDTMVDVTGLPPGPETLLDWLRRGITDEAGVSQGIREGHTKVKYVDEYLAARWRVLSAPEYAGLWLRGWITEAEAKAGGARTGYDGAAMDLLYRNRGRPATTRQVHIGYARGGALPGAANERAAFEQAVRQSNIRTEYTELLWASRYTYPSPFVIRALASDGTFDNPTTRQILVESGWDPQYAALAADAWTGATEGAAKQKWADRARSRLFTITHNEYLDGSIDAGTATAKLAAVGVPAAERGEVLRLWDEEGAIDRLELSPAQIKKAYTKGVYSREVATAELVERGQTPEDAATYLDS